jgi:hypothetical protein
MNFKSNLSKLALLSNRPLKIFLENKEVTFVPPTVAEYFTDMDFIEFYSSITTPVEKMNEILKDYRIILDSRYGILKLLLKTSERKEVYYKILQKMLPNVEIKENLLYFNAAPLTNEEYDYILNILEVSCGTKKLEEFEKEASVKKLSEYDRKMQEQEERIKRIKESKNKVKLGKDENKSEAKTITIDQIVIALTYEFASLTINTIFDLNVFTFLYFYGQLNKIVDNQIQIQAAGNGLTKKFTYFINRGEN